MQTVGCQRKIEYHWSQFRVADSALTLSKLSGAAFLNGCTPKNTEDPLWTEIFATTPEKREALVTYWVGVYVGNLKNAARLKKSFNLKHQVRFFADKYRASKTDDEAYKTCALFTHFAPQIRAAVTDQSWEKLVARFRRGGFDNELQEKCACEKADLNISDFRFLQGFGAEIEKKVPTEDILDVRQQEAQLVREDAQLAEASVTIAREQTMWMKYMEEKTIWESSSNAQKSAFKMEQDQKNNEVIKREIDLRFPSRELSSDAHIQGFVQSSIQAWVDPCNGDANEVYKVWVLNLTIPGSRYQQAATKGISKAADQIASSPDRSCAIVLAPNCGAYGDSYSTENVRQAKRDVEEILKDPDLRVLYQEITLSFDEETIATQSMRPSVHTAFMVISDQRKANGELVSHFPDSKLWIRQAVSQLRCMQMKDMVSLLSCNSENKYLLLNVFQKPEAVG